MAFYTDSQFQVPVLTPVAFAQSFGTATASAVTGANAAAVAYLPKLVQRSKITAVRMQCTTIPDAGSTALKANFLNGTNTFAVVTLTTATVGQWLDATMTEANATIADDIAPTVNVVGTATASADANGSYSIWFEIQKQYD